MSKIKTIWPIIILIISLTAIVSALIAEYVFNILPCEMCLFQRYPYYFMIAFSIFFLISKKISLKLYYWICTIFFSIGLLFSVWHVGIEQKIFKGLPGCTGKINISQSLTDLKQQILNQNIASCDEVTWSFMNISAATLNSLLLIFLLIINSIFLLQQYYKKR